MNFSRLKSAAQQNEKQDDEQQSEQLSEPLVKSEAEEEPVDEGVSGEQDIFKQEAESSQNQIRFETAVKHEGSDFGEGSSGDTDDENDQRGFLPRVRPKFEVQDEDDSQDGFETVVKREVKEESELEEEDFLQIKIKEEPQD